MKVRQSVYIAVKPILCEMKMNVKEREIYNVSCLNFSEH